MQADLNIYINKKNNREQGKILIENNQDEINLILYLDNVVKK